MKNFSRKLVLTFSFLGTLTSLAVLYFVLKQSRTLSEIPGTTILLCLVGITLFHGIVLFLLARWFTKPLDQLSQTAHRILLNNSKENFRIESEDEVSELARVLNGIQDRSNHTLQTVRSERDKVYSVLNSMIEHVITVNLQGNIQFLNPAAEKLFGVRLQDAIGKHFLEVIRQVRISQILRSVLESHQENFEEIQLFLPDEKVFEVRAIPMGSGSQEVGALLVLHEVTRIHYLEKVRRDFVANVSHELRTPLTSIQGFSETLLSGALSDSKVSRDFLETIHSESVRLNHLVEDLLHLSLIESGKKKLHLVPCSLRELVLEVWASLKPLAKKIGVTMETHLPLDFPPLNGDPSQLKQVFTNLIDNAIKFNKKGGEVVIEASLQNGSIHVDVRDTGIGIPERDLPRIFERFYRVDKARSRELGGTGLGLSIVKHIVENHGGTIHIQSIEDSGSTISLSFPL